MKPNIRIFHICFVFALWVSLPATAAEQVSSNDYGRTHIGGMRGHIEWESLLSGNGLEGWETKKKEVWSREGNTIVVNAGTHNHTSLSTGDTTWSNYELKVAVTFVKGSNLQIQFRRSSDGKDRYFVDFLSGWKAISVTKRDHTKPGVTKLDVMNFPFKFKHEYDLVIAVRGASIHTYLDGQLVNRVTHDFRRRGGIALATWGKSTIVKFRNPRIRHYH